MASVHLLISVYLSIVQAGVLPQDDLWLNLLDKLKAEGKEARLEPAVFNHSGTMLRGAAASQDLKPGDIVLSLPSSLSVNIEGSEAKALFGHHVRKAPLKDQEEGDVPGWLQLTALLATERKLGKSSPWHDYIAHLPTLAEFQSFLPVFASDNLLHRFAPLPLVHDVAGYRKWIEEDWEDWSAFVKNYVMVAPISSQRARKLREAALTVNKDDLSWSFAVVLTRAFSVSPHAPIVLEPLADDLNMAQTQPLDKNNIHWFRQWGTHSDDPVFVLRATKAVKSGSELLESYGDNDNEGLAAQWGFQLPGKSKDVEILPTKDCEFLVSTIEEPLLSLQKKSQFLLQANKHQLKDAGRTHFRFSRSLGCVPPKTEAQPIIFCSLVSLARQHCRMYKNFP